MRKYKSKFMKPYIRKLKAGDLKRITSQMTFQALLNECIIDYARQYKKQVYVLTFAGSRDILDVSMNKKKLRNSIVAIDTSNREYNIIRNSWKRSIQRMKQRRKSMKRLINPNRRQKLFLAEHGLKSENWKIEKETPEYLYIVSKNGQHRLLNKN